MKFTTTRGIVISTIFLLASACNSNDRVPDLPAVVDFNYHIKPLLSDRCFACHGPDEKAREAKLSLHTAEGAFAALEGDSSRFIIAPGDINASELYHRVVSEDPEYMMPPPSSNLMLTDYDKALITKWIKQGASWKKHWAFIPPTRPSVPKITNKDWQENPIDAFVFEKLKAHDLKPAPEENPERWLRRVYFDITGLPPDITTIDSFLTAHAERDYEKIVDRLLASPAYGERMASIWLDLARYADSHGYQDDKPRSIWPWRDWVIKAFNENMPYDQFVTNQIAGDLVQEPTYEQKLATAFNRNHAITQEGGVINEEYLTEYAADRVQTFATSFLGLTLQCARCHDHKYDPISQKEYFELFGFFNNVEGERGQISYFDLAPVPAIELEDKSYETYIEEVKNKISTLETKLDQLPKEEKELFESWKHQDFGQDQINLDATLQAHYNFNDQQWTFKDLVSNTEMARVNINLPPSIERPEKVSGVEESALKFNGDNFVSLGDVGDFDHYQSFTISSWVNHESRTTKDLTILGRRVDEQYKQGYDLTLLKNGKLAFRLIHNINAEQLEVQTKDKLPARGWHHLAITYDGSGKASGVKIYVDGQKKNATTIRDDLKSLSILNGIDFTVGHWNQRMRGDRGQIGFKDGKVDQVRIYGSQLSPIQIKKLAKNESKNTPDELFDHYLLNHSIKFSELKNTLDSLRSLDTSIPKIMIMQERDTIEPAYVLDRGVYDAKLYPVSRATPSSILTFEESDTNRLGLANWLFNQKNPLTARVAVNRFWQQFFGQGLVKSAEDFGNQGDLPTHPELLDWLAVQFREQNWDVKALIKQMVLSKTYRQSSAVAENKRKEDVSNQWLARGPYRPLTAEMSRDQALKVSGLLYEQIGGKWVKPYQPGGIWKELANQIGENKYRVSRGRDKYRRSLYTYWKRTIPPPTMLTLDAPERSVCTVRRQMTSTPLQALIILNDPSYVEASRHLAEQIIRSDISDSRGQIAYAFLKIVNRNPKDAELDRLEAFFGQMKNDYKNKADEIQDLLSIGDSPPSIFADPSTGAALTLTVSTIFNLDEARYR